MFKIVTVRKLLSPCCVLPIKQAGPKPRERNLGPAFLVVAKTTAAAVDGVAYFLLAFFFGERLADFLAAFLWDRLAVDFFADFLVAISLAPGCRTRNGSKVASLAAFSRGQR